MKSTQHKNTKTLIVLFSLFLLLININYLRATRAPKVAFITGGSTGIGAATIELFMKQKIKVGFLDKNIDAGSQLAQRFSLDEILFIQGDVSKVQDIRLAIEATVKKFGHLDIIFANAGIYQLKPLLEMSETDWHHVIDINLKGVVFTVKEALPYLIKNGGGSIVLMGSDQCFIGKQSSCVYGMTKGAIAQFTKSTALDYGKNNIRVNAVCPGTIRTPLAETVFKQIAQTKFNGNEDKVWQAEAAQYPLGRCGTSEEVANLVYFLASDQASFITGSLYAIDGGFTAQ